RATGRRTSRARPPSDRVGSAMRTTRVDGLDCALTQMGPHGGPTLEVPQHFAPRVRRQRAEHGGLDAVAEEPDRAVGEGELRAAGMAAPVVVRVEVLVAPRLE